MRVPFNVIHEEELRVTTMETNKNRTSYTVFIALTVAAVMVAGCVDADILSLNESESFDMNEQEFAAVCEQRCMSEAPSGDQECLSLFCKDECGRLFYFGSMQTLQGFVENEDKQIGGMICQ